MNRKAPRKRKTAAERREERRMAGRQAARDAIRQHGLDAAGKSHPVQIVSPEFAQGYDEEIALATRLLNTTSAATYREAGGNTWSSANQDIRRDLVQRNVLACLSGMIYDLREFPRGEYYEEVLAVSGPVEDYLAALEEADADADWIEAARDLNTESRSFVLDLECLGDERRAEAEDAGEEIDLDAIRNEEARKHVLEHCRDDRDDARIACEALEIEPHSSDIYEHWAVDPWFARKLGERGEKTVEIYNLSVWGRGCTGQAIYMDHVIAEIAAGMEILHYQQNDWSHQRG